MKILPITIASLSCLFLVAGIEIEKKSLKIDDLDVIRVSNLDGDSSKSTGAQRKRDSGYAYDRPVRLLSPNHREIVRGRILAKRPSGQTPRPFDHYGPPNYRNQPLKSQNHNGHQQQHQQHQQNDFKSAPGRGQTQQGVPSPTRDYEFVEPSPIAEQNTIPFNSNAANYLPPRNQKLPYVNDFPKSAANRQIPTNRQPKPARQQSQNLLGGTFSDHQQISDGATFLTQNSQAISQLYETPATNLNYEPLHESQQSSQNSGFQIANTNSPIDRPESNQDTSRFPSNLPSYASGFLESREAAIRDVQSLEKDRLIVQLQRALIDAQSNADFPSTSVASVRYAQNHVNPNYISNKNHHEGYQGAINPSIGPQLDRPKNHDNRGSYGADFGYQPEYTYGPPSTTPANQALITTTLAASTNAPSPTHQPNLITSSGQASSQVPTSITPVSSTPNRIPQYGFVPTFIGPTFIPNYPTYATNFVTPGASTINHVSSSSPTHFGIPIPSLGPSQTVPTNSETFGNNDGSSSHQPTSGTTLQPIRPIQTVQPIRPIQPIIPISPVHHGFNVVPTVTQIHPIQTVSSTLGQPTYGLQPTVVNPIIPKPIKAVYPIYYYPNVFQIQKSGTLPWNYAPSYTQTRQAQIWK